jgi:hypothetical protein
LPIGNMATRGEIHVSWGQVNTDEFQQLLEENEGSWLMEKQTNGKRPAQKSYCSWIAKDFPQEGTRDSGFFGLSFHVEPNHVQADASGAVFNKVGSNRIIYIDSVGCVHKYKLNFQFQFGSGTCRLAAAGATGRSRERRKNIGREPGTSASVLVRTANSQSIIVETKILYEPATCLAAS